MYLPPSRKEAVMPDSDTPVMDTLALMTAASLENSDLPPREFMIARIAALAAVDAPAASYALNVGPAADSGITLTTSRTSSPRWPPSSARLAWSRRRRASPRAWAW